MQSVVLRHVIRSGHQLWVYWMSSASWGINVVLNLVFYAVEGFKNLTLQIL